MKTSFHQVFPRSPLSMLALLVVCAAPPAAAFEPASYGAYGGHGGRGGHGGHGGHGGRGGHGGHRRAAHQGSQRGQGGQSGQRGQGHGPMQMMQHLLDGVDLRDGQRAAIDRLTQGDFRGHEAHQAATVAYRGELARQVRAGSFDQAALDKLLAIAAQELGAPPDPRAGFLAELHPILDGAQRAKVAENIGNLADGGGRGRPNERGEGEDRGRPGQPGGGEDRGRPPAFIGPRFQHLTEALALTPAQTEAISAAMRETMRAEPKGGPRGGGHPEMAMGWKNLADRFRKDTFALGPDDRSPGAMALKPMVHLTQFAVVATPHLTPNQRIQMGKHLENPPGHRD